MTTQISKGFPWWLKLAEPGKYPVSVCVSCDKIISQDEIESEMTMLKRTSKPDRLTQALDSVSYEWLLGQHPQLADVIAAEVDEGVSPVEIRRRVMAHCQRWELALRCEQAARWLVGE